jgi:hypothetical protein
MVAGPRVHVLPERGTLLVCTDLHGNGDDFRRLRRLFFDALARDPDTQWVILGDIVHGPSPEARARRPELYDYDDESWAIAEGILALRQAHPGRVHFILGNHDYAHLGGTRTRKFYPDEAAHLESRLDEAQRVALHGLFRGALLAAVAPCGLFLTHGSPDDSLRSLEDLNAISLPPTPGDSYAHALLDSFLNSYGQAGDVTARLLQTVSVSGAEVSLVVHGHDKDESGYFTEGGNQVCPVLFGALRENKRYLQFDLAARYRRPEELREGVEIRRLHPHGPC